MNSKENRLNPNRYVIEKKGKNGNWAPAKEVPGGKTTATVDGLIKGEEYQFRVIAINKAGPGESADPSDPVVAKPRFRTGYTYSIAQ